MSRASIDEAIEQCRKCERTVPFPFSHYCDRRSGHSMDVFDEHALGREIRRQWGAHGAHAEVFEEMMKRLESAQSGDKQP